jgi:hypothetical protein
VTQSAAYQSLACRRAHITASASIASVERCRHVGCTPNSGRMAATQRTDASGQLATKPNVVLQGKAGLLQCSPRSQPSKNLFSPDNVTHRPAGRTLA